MKFLSLLIALSALSEVASAQTFPSCAAGVEREELDNMCPHGRHTSGGLLPPAA